MEHTKTGSNLIALCVIINAFHVSITVKIALNAEEIDKMNLNVVVLMVSMMISSLNFVNRVVFLVIPVIFLVV